MASGLNQIPIIPKAESISVHTGNVVNWNRLKRKIVQGPTEELTECISSTIESWLTDHEAEKDYLQEITQLNCLNKTFQEPLPIDERDNFKVTAKIYLCDYGENIIEEAVNSVLTDLGIAHIETVLLAFSEKHRNLDTLQASWVALEKLHKCLKVFTLGVADLNKTQLEELYTWAEVKPSINQVNLDSCCVMPTELVEFAKDYDIQLLTHSDPHDILTETAFQGVMTDKMTSRDSENWKPSWVLRYSVLIKCRGVIHAKGYIMKALRDVKQRK
ncbi:Glutamate--cysteine ligase regulatory subunit [Lamellibrachia satsuma]|nr:Glutamate--cysteine ligase regulatory subunit [Lamellibrachia satsuma]